MTEPQAEPDVFDGVATIVLGDVLMSLWRTPARLARIRRVMALTEGLMRTAPGTIVACQFLLSTASPPTWQEHGEIRAGLRVVLPRARRLITVPLGDAAWHSVVRGIFRAALALTGHSKVIKVAADLPEGLSLVTAVASRDSPTTSALESAVDTLHLALDLTAPRCVR